MLQATEVQIFQFNSSPISFQNGDSVMVNAPERLPQERTLPDIKKELKSGYREMKKLDKPKNKQQ